jgi:hypothetical protein
MQLGNIRFFRNKVAARFERNEKKRNLKVAATTFSIIFPVIVIGLTFQPGTTGFQFLKLGVGARPVAMGSAYTAVADDANALFWNPAGLGMSESFQGTLMIMDLFQSVTYAGAGISTPLGKFINAGLAGSYLTASDTRRNPITGREEGSFPISDFLIGPGLAFNPIENLAFGGAIKFLGSRLDSFTSYAVSIDAGIIYSLAKYFYLGSSLLHFGTPRKFISNLEYQPTNLRIGAAGKVPIYEHSLIIASDVSVYSDNLPTVSVGAEGKVKLTSIMKIKGSNQWLAVRAGYQTGYNLGFGSGFSFGIGYEYELAPALQLVIDAVYLSYGLLGQSERVSLSLRFIPKD